MRLPKSFLVLSILAGVFHATAPASAAVRLCYASVSSDVMNAPQEIEAKKLALLQWQELVEKKYGPAKDAWRLATGRALKCFPKDNGFECVAVGSPCFIQNNPNQKPLDKSGKEQPL